MESTLTFPQIRFPLRAFGIAGDRSSQTYLSERVGTKLGKFASHIHRLEIRMKHTGWIEDEPRVSCSMAAILDGGARVAVERCSRAPREAFDHAMGVAERLIRRTLQRERHR